MTYMKNGGLIRLVAAEDLPRFLKRGFVPFEANGAPSSKQSVKRPAKKPPERSKEGKPHGA